MKKSPSSGGRTKVTKVVGLLLFLAALKLTLLGSLAVDNLTVFVAEAVIPVVGIDEAQAKESQSKEATPQNSVQEKQKTEDNTEATEESAQKKPQDIDEADWKILKKREKELAEKERRLESLETQLKLQLAEIEKRNGQLRRLLADVHSVESERMQKLIKAYANMKAKSAAAVLETMSQDLAVKILAGLGGRQAGEILGFIETRKAAVLSEALTDLHVPFDD